MSKLITNKKTYIVTTSLPYVNSIPHIGFAFEAVIADTISRYLRSIGKKVVFISGTDDNSFKLVLKAKESGEETQSFIDDFAKEFLKLQEKLCLSYDIFYRTSSKSHGDFVNKYIDSINKGLIFQKDNEFSLFFGLYTFLSPPLNLSPTLFTKKSPQLLLPLPRKRQFREKIKDNQKWGGFTNSTPFLLRSEFL